MFFRRKNYFTKKGFQSRFMARFLVASLLANVVTVTLFIILAKNKIDRLLFSMRLPNSGAAALLSSEALFASIIAVVVISILYLLAARDMHLKIAGPLQRIRTDLHTIGSGDLSCRVTLRDDDEFKDFADEINAMTEALNRRFSGLRMQADTMEAPAKSLIRAMNPAESQAAIQRIGIAVRELHDQIRAVKL